MRAERERGRAAERCGAGGRGAAGTHYSNIGSVLYFLLRLEPFTKLGVDLQATPFAPAHSRQSTPNALEYPAYCQSTVLQGGAFDHPERLFHSIAQSWQNCLASRTDLKVCYCGHSLTHSRRGFAWRLCSFVSSEDPHPLRNPGLWAADSAGGRSRYGLRAS